jgi:nitrite reductase/ring-hydroxylating ferredoxin subunit
MPGMNRRRVLACGLAFAAGIDVAQAGLASIDFVPLKNILRVPLASLADLWIPVSFKAWFTKSDGLDAVAPGVAFRIPSGVVTFCTYCPHELCIVALNDAARELQCPCHGGRFDPLLGGAWLGGPPPRSAYRFQYGFISDHLEINGVEAELRRRLQ